MKACHVLRAACRSARGRFAIGLAVFGMLLLNLESLYAQEPDSDAELIAAVTSMAKRVATQCEFNLQGDHSTKLEMHQEPILRWSNPTAGKVFGDVYVWTHRGRPTVIAGMFRWFTPNWGETLEVCSLAEGRVIGRAGDVQYWAPEKPGLTLKPVADSDPPSKSASTRLVQMRRLAAKFSAQLTDTRGGVAGVPRELRMLTQPVYRYPTNDKDAAAVDGALFAFVEGTDPEAFFLLEAQRSGTEMQWQFGFARMNRDALRGSFRNETVWTAPKMSNQIALTHETYTLFSLEVPPLKQALALDSDAKP